MEEIQSGEPIAECRVRMDVAFHRAYTRLLRGLCTAAAIVGIVLVAAFVTLGVLRDEGIVSVAQFWLDVLLWGGAALFAVGIVLLLTIRSAIRKSSSPVLDNVYTFYEEGLSVHTYCENTRMATADFRYTDFAKVSERGKFLLLRYNAATVYVVPTEGFAEEERARLRAVLRLPPKTK